jgi:hypothetical protein
VENGTHKRKQIRKETSSFKTFHDAISKHERRRQNDKGGHSERRRTNA